MKKIVGLIIFLVTLFSLFLYFYFRPSDYELTYQVNKFKISEKYDKQNKKYLIKITNKDNTFEFITYDKYTNKRQLINKIDVENFDNSTCLKVQSNYLNIYPLCKENNIYISYYAYKQDNNEKVIKNYENFKVYDFNNQTFLLWNYHNIVYLNKDKTNKYQILDNDIYNLKLPLAFNNYLLIPNQENEYSFNTIDVIDIKKNKLKTIKLDKDIYFDSYYLGNIKDKVYIVDRKNEEEYELNIKNGKLTKIKNPKIYQNGKWEKVSITKLINNNYSFASTPNINYELKDSTLYAKIDSEQIKVSNRKITSIITTKDDKVYYLSEDTLYYFDLLNGEKKLLTYNEWQFNSNNMIYVFD